MNLWLIIAGIHTTSAVVKGLNGIRFHDLCETGAVLYHSIYHPSPFTGILRTHKVSRAVEHCTDIAEIIGLNPVQT